ncbi:hypothetical protein [Clostridium weizhouense]|uniref:Carboxymuconolactone decarboxylase n=1 Tax=Clostridium weizhouense TaxID=2859781 RepID=A0ABS7AKT7_9CLOT|nr:hypothetical protein [Clostridium weizhouense]MBW6409283.1 hypothetical protein [Clostridium weizhouense]
MDINYSTLIMTLINFALLIMCVFIVFKAIRGFKNFIIRNKAIDQKLDTILDKLKEKN